ncbi:MAG: ketopantoate reductase PanE/ApbA family protein [Nocardia sp.]|uniref:ketopantoate reductase family protein n=1 Tax=Nocardia sp. TaxID=1821 RepID=UPI00261D4BA1|nr:2-dehydropantoate 2-reductase N-terminal domain-containing protein [Nocardia sp.]MCU1641773.1 ketopantoate reductase PanE/ApbA family protein [Nocardia sp.]
MTRYVIVGAGAVGVSLAVELGDRGHEILLVARGATLDHLARQPLSYHSQAGHREVRLPVAALTDDLGLRVGDIVVFAVKSQDLPAVAPAIAWRDVTDAHGRIRGLAADLVPVVTAQNGLDAERTAARWFDTVLGAVFLISAQHVRTGEVRVGGHPYVGGVIAGIANAASPAAGEQPLQTFTTDLQAANFRAEAVTDIRAYKAAKILLSVNNGIAIFAGDRTLKDAVSAALTAEAKTVLAAAGITHHNTTDLTLDPAQENFTERSGVIPGRSSTWQSFARGTSANEVDYLNGEIALLARLHHVPAPLNARLQQLLGRATHSGGGIDLPGLGALAALLPANHT